MLKINEILRAFGLPMLDHPRITADGRPEAGGKIDPEGGHQGRGPNGHRGHKARKKQSAWAGPDLHRGRIRFFFRSIFSQLLFDPFAKGGKLCDLTRSKNMRQYAKIMRYFLGLWAGIFSLDHKKKSII